MRGKLFVCLVGWALTTPSKPPEKRQAGWEGDEAHFPNPVPPRLYATLARLAFALEQ